MAVRPLVTTGVALLSAGALVAGTPALFVPRDEITVAASTAEATVHRTMTAEQINLVALSLQGAWQSFTQGYGGYYYQGVVTGPTTGYILNEDDELEYPDESTPADTALVDRYGRQLYYENEEGQLVAATVGDMGDGVQFYDQAGNEANENYYAPGDCSASGAVCKDGFTGLAYYLSDNILPLDVVDNIFFEAGFNEFAYLGSVIGASIVDAFDPTQRLQLSKRVDEFFTGGAAMVVGSILNDNLPDGGFAQNLSNSFFFGYGANTGITAAVTYVVDAITQGTLNPVPGGVPEEEVADVSLLSAQQETAVKTEAEPGSVTSTSLPNVSKLLSLPTDIESSFKKLAEKLEAPAESKLVKTLEVKAEDTTVDEAAETAEESTGAVTPAVEVSKPEAPKFELPKLDLGLKLTPKTTTTKEVTEVKETAAQEESEEKAGGTESADTGATTKAPNKFAPKSSTTERKKSAGERFVENATKNLEKAFKPTTKAGADKQDTAKGAAATGASAKGASGGDSSAHAGNAHADNKDSKSNDTKGNKDNKDSKSHKDK